MSPISFTDEELDLLTTLAAPIPPSSRDAFLQEVANQLAGYPPEQRGCGLLHRIAVTAQRNFVGVITGKVTKYSGAWARSQRQRERADK